MGSPKQRPSANDRSSSSSLSALDDPYGPLAVTAGPRPANSWLNALDDPSARLVTRQALTSLIEGIFFVVDGQKQVLRASRDGDFGSSLELPWMPSCIATYADGSKAFALLAHGASVSLVETTTTTAELRLRLVCQLDLPYLPDGIERDVVNQCLTGSGTTVADISRLLFEQLSADDGAKLSATGKRLTSLEATDGIAAVRSMLDAVSEITCMVVVTQRVGGPLLVVATCDGWLAHVEVSHAAAAAASSSSGYDSSQHSPVARLLAPLRARSLGLPAAPLLIAALETPATASGSTEGISMESEAIVAVACADCSLCVIRGAAASSVIGGSLPPRALCVCGQGILLITDGRDHASSVASCFALSGQRIWTREFGPLSGACVSMHVPVPLATGEGELCVCAFALARADAFVEVIDAPELARPAPATGLQRQAEGSGAQAGNHAANSRLGLSVCEVDVLPQGLRTEGRQAHIPGESGRSPGGGAIGVQALHFGTFGLEPRALLCVTSDGALHVRILGRKSATLQRLRDGPSAAQLAVASSATNSPQSGRLRPPLGGPAADPAPGSPLLGGARRPPGHRQHELKLSGEALAEAEATASQPLSQPLARANVSSNPPALASELGPRRAALDRIRGEQRIKAMLLRTPPARAAAMGLTAEALQQAREQRDALEQQALLLEAEIAKLELA